MAKEFVFYVTEDAELSTLGQVVEFIKNCTEDSVRKPVTQSVIDFITDAEVAGGIYPALAGSWFYTGKDGEFIHAQSKGVLKVESNAALQLEIDRISILEELKSYGNYLGDIEPIEVADAVATLRRLPKNVLIVLFGIENKPPVRAQEKTSRDGNTKTQVVVTDAEREAITANIVEAIRSGKFPATPAGKSPLQDFDYDIRIGGKRDYQTTAKANQVYLELFEGDDVLVSDKGEKPNVNRKKKWIAQGLDREYFERAKAKLGIK